MVVNREHAEFWGELEAHDSWTGPSFGRRVANYAAAQVAHALAGRRKLTKQQSDARLAICRGCELYSDGEGRLPAICKHPRCGCHLETKATWAEQQCPIGKWPKA